MILARIVGTVVATRKDPRLVSSKLLVARPMDPHGKSEGNYLVAIDTVDAGVGDEGLSRGRRDRRHRGHRRSRRGGLMQLAKVIGDVVITRKDENLTGIK